MSLKRAIRFEADFADGAATAAKALKDREDAVRDWNAAAAAKALQDRADAVRDTQAIKRRAAMSDVVYDLYKSKLSHAWNPAQERRDTAEEGDAPRSYDEHKVYLANAWRGDAEARAEVTKYRRRAAP